MASNLLAMASNLLAMVSNLLAMASNLIAMASNVKAKTLSRTEMLGVSDQRVYQRQNLVSI